MKLFTKAINDALAKQPRDDVNNKPILKLFGGGACTWLISEREDDDRLFGLCDLGLGCPELGYVSQAELETLRFPPFGLPIERDLSFKADKTLAEYAEIARQNQRIIS